MNNKIFFLNKNNRWIKPIDFYNSNLEKIEQIAKGGFASVWKCKLSGFVLAAKIYYEEKLNENFIKKIEKEISIMEKLNHPNIITYLGYEIKGNQYCVLMEYLPFSLWDIIKNIKDNKRSMFSKEEIIFCCIEILKALNYMHQLPEKILHRDLKSKNILVELKFGKIFMVKLCDLGDSTEYKEEIKTLNTIGTIRWTAPEILSLSQENKNIKYDEKSEIWSFAMVIYEILTLNLPYYEYEINDVKIQINQKKLPSTKNIDIKFLPILNLLKPCWNFNPKERPFVNQLLNDFLVMQK